MMLDHDKRADLTVERQRSNKNIDPKLSYLNRDYSVRKLDPAEAQDYAIEFAQAHSSRKIRSNGIYLSMDVIHLPDNWDEVSGGADSLEFFENVALPFERQRYGYDGLANEVSAVVHRDEKKLSSGRDHLHYKYVPVTKDGRLSHKQVNGRSDLSSYHKDLQAFAERQGYHGLHLYDEERARSREKALTMPEYKEAVKELERVDAAKDAEIIRLHSVAQFIDEKEELCQELARGIEEQTQILSSLKDEIAEEQSRLECLRQRSGELASSIDGCPVEAEAVIARSRKLAAEMEALASGKAKAGGLPASAVSRKRSADARARGTDAQVRVESLRKRFDDAKKRCLELMDSIKRNTVVHGLSAWAQKSLNRSFNSLNRAMREKVLESQERAREEREYSIGRKRVQENWHTR